MAGGTASHPENVAAQLGGAAVVCLLVLVPLAGALLTSPVTGGASQWGPRYALFTVPPLAVLAVDAATRLLARVRGTRLLPVAAIAVAVLTIAGLAATRAAYRETRGAKRMGAEVSRAITAEPPK
jgi:hypothetical protein